MQRFATPTLSARERDLLYLLVRGRTLAQAARTVGIDPDIAETILQELQARNGIEARQARTKLIVRAMILGWV